MAASVVGNNRYFLRNLKRFIQWGACSEEEEREYKQIEEVFSKLDDETLRLIVLRYVELSKNKTKEGVLKPASEEKMIEYLKQENQSKHEILESENKLRNRVHIAENRLAKAIQQLNESEDVAIRKEKQENYSTLPNDVRAIYEVVKTFVFN